MKMPRIVTTFPAIFLIAAFAAGGLSQHCAAAAETTLLTVRGTLSFPDETSVPEDGVAVVEIRDGAAPDGTPGVAQQRITSIGGREVPFTLQIDHGRLADGKDYVIRGTILNGQTATWLSNAVPVDAGKDLIEGMRLALKPFNAPPAGEATGTDTRLPDIQGVEWVVDDIDGASVIETSDVTLNFGVDGALSGHASCNTFRSTYSVDGDALKVDNTVTTDLECAPDLMKQEHDFIDIVSHAKRYKLDTDGALIIEDADGRSLSASSE